MNKYYRIKVAPVSMSRREGIGGWNCEWRYLQQDFGWSCATPKHAGIFNQNELVGMLKKIQSNVNYFNKTRIESLVLR